MKYLFPFFLSILILSCHSKSNEAETKNTQSDSVTGAKPPAGFTVKQLSGLFFDTLPCANCPGVATTIYLKPDQTFVIQRQYVGKGIAYETGIWTMNDSLLQLKGDSVHQFKIKSHALIEMLDAQGKEIVGTTKNVALRRNNIPFKPLQPVPVEGMFKSNHDTMAIHICSMNKEYEATLAPAALLTTAKYKQVAKHEGQPVFAKVAGHFELRPSLNDTTTQDFFVIEKLISFDPKGACK